MLIAALTLGGLFTDHMVLQRGRANPLWGRDVPGQVVTLTVEGAAPAPQPVQVETAPDGTWRLLCPQLPAGGPYRLRFAGSTEVVISDVLVGDVWLASGQSNMEFLLAGASDGEEAIAKANYPNIRVAKIPHRARRDPETDVGTAWSVCSPETAGSFTAVGYFFAREIHRTTGVPIGIIDSTWGGTRVEAWTSVEGLRGVWPEVDAERAAIAARDPELPAIREAYRKRLEVWERKSFPQDEENRGEAEGCASPEFEDGDWRQMNVPAVMQRHGFEGNGAAWFRRTVHVPPAWAGQDLVLQLGAVDDFDITYFNGVRVGATGSETLDAYQVNRRYTVPGRLVRAGENVVAVRVFDRFGDGGLVGPAFQMAAHRAGDRSDAIALTGTWRWQVERLVPRVSNDIYRDMPPAPPELAVQHAPAYLFNGMIAPLVGYGVRGFLWYQGESNVGRHREFALRFPAMIRDWRARWGAGTLPFYFVQLAGFRQNGDWPWLREAQTHALLEPETGMALAIDVGDPVDIHPTNKRAVGVRLALLARAGAYGEPDVIAHGPAVRSVRIEGNTVRVQWDHADALRTTDGSTSVKGFSLASADGRYVPARARIDGTSVLIEADDLTHPVMVRYAWEDYTELNLVNGAGLPAEPFRTDDY